MLSPSSTRTQLNTWLVHYERAGRRAQPLLDSGHNTGKRIQFWLLRKPSRVGASFFFKNYVEFVHGTQSPELIGHDVFVSLVRARVTLFYDD